MRRFSLFFWLVFTLVFSIVFVGFQIVLSSEKSTNSEYSCTSNVNCSLNGHCISNSCQCSSPWKGNRCDELTILPHPVDYVPAYGYKPNVTSWGGNMIKDEDGLYHLFVSEMKDGLGLNTWNQNSQIIHAVGSDPMVPFQRVNLSLPAFAHNASPIRGKNPDGSPGLWYIFHIGSAGNIGNTGSFIHVSESPYGPWRPLPNIAGKSCNNPAPAFHPNGTLYCLCYSTYLYRTNDPTDGNSWIRIAKIDYTKSVGAVGWTEGPGTPPDEKYLRVEDPYIWFDRDANFHALFHRYDYRYGNPPNPDQIEPHLVSAHAYSPNGFDWYFNDRPPFYPWIDFTNGTRQHFATWERPHLVFNEDGLPTHLIVGVSAVWPCIGCEARPGSNSSCVVCKTTVGLDWTYTLVNALDLD